MDELNIVISGILNEKKTVSNIASQIEKIQKQIKDINIGLDLSDFKSEFEKMAKSFARDVSKQNIYDSKKDKTELEKTKKELKKIYDELDGYKKSKTSETYVDSGDGEKLKKITEQYKNELNESVDIIRYINTETGNLISIEKKYTDSIEDRNKELKKELDLQNKISREIENRLKRLPKSAIGTSNTNDLYGMLNTSQSSEDLKALQTLVNDYYKDCIDLERKLNKEKKDTHKDTVNAFKDEENKLNFIYSRKKKLLEIEREINNASLNKGIKIDGLDVNGVKDSLSDVSSSGYTISNEDKARIDDMINRLQYQLKLEKDIVEINNKKINAYTKLDKQLEKINDIIIKNDRYDSNSYDNLIGDIEKLRSALDKGEISFLEFEQRVRQADVSIDKFSNSSKDLSATTNSLSHSIKRFAAFYSLYDILELGKRAVSGMVESIFSLDDAITELNKVAQIDDIGDYVNDMYELGEQLAKTGSAMTQISAGFARAGFRDDDLSTLSEVAGMMMNVGDSAMGLEDTVGGLTSALLGFKLPAEQAMNLLHSMNNIANNSNNKMSDLVMALQRTSGTMGAFGVEYQKALGMFGAANEILMSPELVTRGLNSLTMRIRGLTDTGEAIDGLTPKLEGLYKSVGVAITDTSGQLLDVYTIMDSLNKVWADLDGNTRQNIAQQSAGIEQAKMFITLQENWSRANEITTLGVQHQNSAFAENERVIQSLNGRVSQLKSTWEQLSNNTLNSEFVKTTIDISNGFLKIVDSVGVANIALIGLTGTMVMFGKAKNINWLTSLPELFAKASAGAATLTTTLLSNPLFLGAVGLVTAIKVIDAVTVSLDEQREKVESLNKEYADLNIKLNNLKKIDNPTEQTEKQITLLEKELALKEKLLDIENRKLAQKEYSSYYGTMSSEVQNLTNNMNNYKRIQNELLNGDVDAKRFENLSKQLTRYEEDIAKYYSEINGAYIGMTEVFDNLTPEQQKNAKQVMDSVGSYMKLADEILGLNNISGKQVEENKNVYDSISDIVNIVDAYTNKIGNNISSVSSLSSEYIGLVDTIKSLQDGNKLSLEQALDIADKYGVQYEAIKKVEGGYVIELDALTSLRDDKVKFLNDMSIAEDEHKTVAIKNILSRCQAIDQEIQSYKDLVNAKRAAINDLDMVKSKTVTKEADPLGIYSSPYMKETISPVFEQAEKEIQKKVDFYDGVLKEWDRLESESNKRKGTLNNLLTGYSGGSKKSSSSSSKKDNTISDAFKKDLNEISKLREEIETKIAELQEAINLDELLGEYDPDKANKMTVLLSQLKGIADIEMGKLNGLKKVYKQQEQISEIESLMATARKQQFSDEMSYQQHMIDLINKKYDIEKRSYDDKVRLINLEQKLHEQGSVGYEALEQQKMDLLIGMQQSYMDKVRELKESGLSQDSEDIRNYIDLWKDAQEEILSIDLEMQKRRRQAEIDSMKKQEEQMKSVSDAKKKILDETIAMIKAEEKARDDAAKKRIKTEVDNMKKLADERKRELQRQKDERSYQKDVDKSNEEISSIQRELDKLMFDNSEWAIAEKLRLAKELADKEEALKDKQLDKEIDKQMDAIDEQVKLFEEQKNKELEIIEDNAMTEYEIRKKALDMIDKDNKKLYKELQKHMLETGKMGKEEFDGLWKVANTGLEQFGIKTKSTLESLDEMYLAMKKLADESDRLSKAPIGGYSPNTGSGNNVNSGDSKKINQMIANSQAWAKAKTQEERDRLSAENQKLGKELGLYYNAGTGKWYRDSGYRIPAWHNGLEKGQVGTGLKPNELIAKLTNDEWVFTGKQFDNLTNNLKGMLPNNQRGIGDIVLNLYGTVTEGAKPMLKEWTKDIEKICYKVVNKSM